MSALGNDNSKIQYGGLSCALLTFPVRTRRQETAQKGPMGIKKGDSFSIELTDFAALPETWYVELFAT